MTQTLKNIIKKYFSHFYYFYSYLRYRIFIALAMSLIVGVLDGFGLAMFLPLLQMVDGQEMADNDSLGNLSFLIDAIEATGFTLTVMTVLCVICFFFVLKGIAKFLDSIYRVAVQQFFIRTLRFANVDKLANYDYKAFILADSGRIQNTLSGEIGRVASAYKYYFMTIQSSVLVAVYISLAFLSNFQFALLVTIGGILSNSIYRQVYKKTKETSRRITHDGHIFQGLLIQMVAFFKYLKATGLGYIYAEKLKRSIADIESSTRRIGFYNSVLASTREPLVTLIVVCVIIIQIKFFDEKLGLIILSLLFFYRALTFLMNVQNQWNSFLNVSGSLENMDEFMNELSQRQDIAGIKTFLGFTDSLLLTNVSFSYSNENVLHNINLKINKNETIAFVGESGSGKTTLVNLLAGLMPVSEGSILVDGTDLRSFDRKTYCSKVGYITQEAVIFSDDIFNNVTFWAERTPQAIAKFWEALRKASIDTFVRSLPNQENSMLGNNGITVSGGQKQRISIARELYKDIEILIMDEATSALDSETEVVIKDNIDSLKGKYTVLIVAHRLATIKNADRVVLVKNGTVFAIDSFDVLKETSLDFKRMVDLQAF